MSFFGAHLDRGVECSCVVKTGAPRNSLCRGDFGHGSAHANSSGPLQGAAHRRSLVHLKAPSRYVQAADKRSTCSFKGREELAKRSAELNKE